MSNSISRRSFLKGSAVAALAAALPNMRAVAEDKTYTYADTIAWDGEYDVAVMGFGGAGAVAAHYAGKKGAKVLLFDVAPKGHEGGNTHYCGQIIACGSNYEGLLTYYRALSEGYDYDDEMLQVLCHQMTQVEAQLVNDYDCNEIVHLQGMAAVSWALPEYPEKPGAENMDAMVVHMGFSDGALWNKLRAKVVSNENVDILYEARGKHLIQDPESKTILGIAIEKDGKMINIRAKNGVVMTCGGFENNPMMVANNLLLHKYNPVGTLYNRGDGITMAAEVNADFWHMGSYEGIGQVGGLGYDVGMGLRAERADTQFEKGSFFIVGSDGKRYTDETVTTKHGRSYYYGSYQLPPYPETSYVIFDEVKMQELLAADNFTESMKSVMTEAESLEELASKLNLPWLVRTAARYNSYVAAGEDEDFGRDPQLMAAFTDGKCYALRAVPMVLNTQGGAKRNARAEVLDVNGNPIPHLYSAGEFGGLTAHYYQGATNIAECIIFGKIAGENAAEPKETLAAYAPRTAVESTLTYMPGCTEEITETTTYEASAENEYIGKGTGMGGDVIVKCTIDGGEVKSVEILQQGETVGIGDRALETLPAKFVGCKTADDVNGVDAVAGATVTSKALKAAVIDCLTQSAAK